MFIERLQARNQRQDGLLLDSNHVGPVLVETYMFIECQLPSTR